MAVRTIFSLRKRQSCREYFFKSKILTFSSIYILETLTFLKQHFPEFDFSTKNQYTLRNSFNLPIPKHKTSFFKKHTLYIGIKLFNSLPLSLKLEPSLSKLKKTIKT
uniref:DNA adenine methyltransferase n=1 Tax=Aster yellows phytoplasma TaxID=35779 RepID=Q847N9_ASTYP|nr:DNA adenine methyltransferase [Aster yellows phytoplasma]